MLLPTVLCGETAEERCLEPLYLVTRDFVHVFSFQASLDRLLYCHGVFIRCLRSLPVFVRAPTVACRAVPVKRFRVQ